MKIFIPSIKKLFLINISIIILFYSSYSLAYKESMRIEFDNQTDKTIYYKFTTFGGSSIYGIIESNRQSNVIDLGEIYPKFVFIYDFILGDIDRGKKLVDERINYSEEEGLREYLHYLHPDYKLNYSWIGSFNIRYKIKKK